ncbi:glycoside hydrolase family 15 protein [Streptomyces sp. NPDC003038]|uniref:glycoside hydrolase family 15 protein n=1 Tax=unclassified Streptomyces TaxID=2593676 RepID=UPI0033B84277
MSEWRPLSYRQGYLPIEDHSLVGDGSACAVVGLDGSVGFLCLPRFDSPPLVCALLDRNRGGEMVLAPDGLREARQHYVPDTGVLVTDMRSAEGAVKVTDAFLLRPGAVLEEDAPAGTGTFLRQVEVVRGKVELRATLQPRGGATVRAGGDPLGVRLTCPLQGVTVTLRSSRPLPGPAGTLSLSEGERFHVSLQWNDSLQWNGSLRGDDDTVPGPLTAASDPFLETVRAWRRWTEHLHDDVPQQALVRRSAITLKMLDNVANGAIVAAATSSLPERIGGNRNWDYRYAWIRDAAYAVFALRRIGLPVEAGGFVTWVLDAVHSSGGPRVVYDIDGLPPPAEITDPLLEGYRRSAPVRWGNAASEQVQHDAYGEILDCAFQWAATGGTLSPALWERLCALTERAGSAWARPDHGIWEVRAAPRPFTYSAAMCQVALHRAARLARRLSLPGRPDVWERQAQHITDRILTDAWDPEQEALTEHLGPGGGLDASLLALPLRRVLAADHPRMAATCRAIAERLDAGGGLLYRYLPQVSPDGIGGPEGAFLLCSFWLVDNLAGQGRVEEANLLFERLCSYAGPTGLLPEQIQPGDHIFLGNFPQGLSHVGLISSAVVLGRIERGIRPELSTHAWFG